MWRLWFGGFGLLSTLLLISAASGQDSGPGPIGGSGSRSYDVLIVHFMSAQQGTFTFSAAGNDTTTSGGATVGAGIGSSTSDPPATSGTGTTTTSTDTTSGAARTGTSTTATSFYQSSGLSSRLNRSSGSYGFNTATGTIATSNDTGTTANVNSSTTTLFDQQIFNSGEFAAQLDTQMQLGTWYAIDLGNYSLWFASASDLEGAITVTGFATPTTISGRLLSTTSTSGGFFPAFFNSAWFFGTSTGGDDTTTTNGTGITEDQTSSSDATAN